MIRFYNYENAIICFSYNKKYYCLNIEDDELFIDEKVEGDEYFGLYDKSIAKFLIDLYATNQIF